MDREVIARTIDAGGTDALDGSTADEYVGRRGATADGAAHGKYGNGADGKPSTPP